MDDDDLWSEAHALARSRIRRLVRGSGHDRQALADAVLSRLERFVDRTGSLPPSAELRAFITANARYVVGDYFRKRRPRVGVLSAGLESRVEDPLQAAASRDEALALDVCMRQLAAEDPDASRCLTVQMHAWRTGLQQPDRARLAGTSLASFKRGFARARTFLRHCLTRRSGIQDE